jgi:hypothetical protein
MKGEKGIQNRPVVDQRGIKFNFDRFNVPGNVLANLAVGRVFQKTAGVANLGIDNTS